MFKIGIVSYGSCSLLIVISSLSSSIVANFIN